MPRHRRCKKYPLQGRFERLGYSFDRDSSQIRHPFLRVIAERYHGMGHSQVLCVNPRRRYRKYIIMVIGGSDGHACLDNESRFMAFRPNDQHFSIRETYRYALRTAEGSPYDSVPSHPTNEGYATV